ELEGVVVDAVGLLAQPVGLVEVGVALAVGGGVVGEAGGEGGAGRADDEELHGPGDLGGAPGGPAGGQEAGVDGVGHGQELLAVLGTGGDQRGDVGVGGQGGAVGAGPGQHTGAPPSGERRGV